jgi:hypothetical protein
MLEFSDYKGFICQYVKRFSNITHLDLSQTTDDLWGEASEVFAKLSLSLEKGEVLSCEFITALGKQIEQRFIQLYRAAKLRNDTLDRETFIENIATRSSKLSRVRFSELPKEHQDLLRKLYEDPETFGKYILSQAINRQKFISYLTKEVGWPRKKAEKFAQQINTNRRKTTNREALTA